MRRTHPPFLAAFCAVLLGIPALTACEGSPGPLSPNPDPAPTPDAGTQPPGNDGGDDGRPGYDARPANPTCVAPERPTAQTSVTTARAFPNLSFSSPLFITHAPGNPSRVYVVEQGGRIRVFENTPEVATSSVFLDLSGKVTCCGERGLLGLAFHPDFAQTGELFVSYTDTPPGQSLRSVVSRMRSTDGGLTADPSTEELVITFSQPYANHNGGHIAFGPDGYLYLGTGDGGSGGDPQNFAQNLGSLLGKFLRLDVSKRPYAIPADNPFAHSGGGAGEPRPERYAWGQRNPWRFTFDPETGELWTGDGGPGALEEVDLIRRGGNYGWRIKEGTRCFNPSQDCIGDGLIDPIVTYPRTEGVSITGGYVYRGSAIPSLRGRYVFGDFGSGKVWAVRTDPATGEHSREELFDSSLGISSFGEAPDGELYLVNYGGGAIHKLVPGSATPPEDTFPQLLSQTGCVDPEDARRPLPGVIPYDVASPLWSDGAAKQRHLAIPDGTQIDLREDGDFDLPNGTVLMKTFLLGERPVETRLFIRHQDGEWGGYSYEWNDEGTDAALLPGAKTKAVAGQTWQFPSRGQCMTCHTEAAGRSLGLELSQLAPVQVTYPSGRTAPQLETLAHIGLFSSEVPAGAALPALPFPADARAYLHANCAGCHRPGGTTQAEMDLRFSTPLAETGTCDVAPRQGALGLAEARLVAPGAPERSLLPVRMRTLDAHRMPPLGTSVVDAEGVALVEGWIAGLEGCP